MDQLRFRFLSNSGRLSSPRRTMVQSFWFCSKAKIDGSTLEFAVPEDWEPYQTPISEIESLLFGLATLDCVQGTRRTIYDADSFEVGGLKRSAAMGKIRPMQKSRSDDICVSNRWGPRAHCINESATSDCLNEMYRNIECNHGNAIKKPSW